MTEKRCPRCKETKPLSEFGKDRRNKDGLNLYCKACKKLYNAEQKDYRREYFRDYNKSEHKKEFDRQYSRAYRAAHPEKSKETLARYRAKLHNNPGDITDRDIHACVDFFGKTCAYSGVSISMGYHIDHVKPISLGGENSLHNIVPCLPVINLQKSNKDFEEWYPKQKFYSEERYNKIKEWLSKT